MSSENMVAVKGNLVKDIEMTTVGDGMPKGKFTVAQNQKWKDSAGNQQEKVHFFPCTIWGRYAEAMAPHLKKGTPVVVLGSLEQLRWEKEGVQQSMVCIKVGTVMVGVRGPGHAGEIPDEALAGANDGASEGAPDGKAPF